MSSSTTFSYKLTTENELFYIDFSQVLTDGEVISSATSTIDVMSGVDPSPQSIKVGAPSINGSSVAQRIYNGIAGVTYRFVITIRTNYGNTYTAFGDIPVYSPSEQ